MDTQTKQKLNKPAESFDEALSKIVLSINVRDHEYLQNIYDNSYGDFDVNKEVLNSGVHQKGNLQNGMRKVASLPVEVHRHFEKIYGPHYFKEKGFFNKRHPEWLTVTPASL